MKHIYVKWVFNTELWGQTMRQLSDEHGIDFVAEILGLTKSGVHGWTHLATATSHAAFPHPSMSNFIAACNTFDLDPRIFFTTED